MKLMAVGKKIAASAVVCVVISSSITGVLLSRSASADTTAPASLLVNSDLVDGVGSLTGINAYTYRYALAECLAFARLSSYQSGFPYGYSYVTRSNIIAGNWFSSDYKVAVGWFANPQDGLKNCGESDFIKAALAALGWTDPEVAACDLGFYDSKNKSVAACPSASQLGLDQGSGPLGAVYSATPFYKKIEAKVGKSLDISNMTPAQQYLFYARTMETGCDTTPVSYLATATASQKATMDGGYRDAWTIMLVNSATQTAPQETIVGAGAGKENVTTVRMYAGNPSNFRSGLSPMESTDKSCIDLAAETFKTGRADAYLTYVSHAKPTSNSNPGGTTAAAAAAAGGTPSNTTCSSSVGSVGWIVCPVLNFMATINDNAYSFISDTFLSFDSTMVTDSGVTGTWGTFRNIANVAFVIVFMIIIFAQVTSMGVSNYGIKRMLPRLIITAVLVNMSLIICQLAVDVSNVVGYGVTNLFSAINVTQGNTSGSVLASGISWVGAVGLALGTVGALVAIFLSVAALPSALLAVGAILLILIARKAIIIIAVILSPLAFVAYLLPNTETLFKKWYKLFYSMLILFPVIGLVFSASKLAANILAKDAGKDPVLQLTALAVSALPFFVVPSLLKSSLDATGKLGSALSGLSSKANARLGKSLSNDSQLGAYKKAWDRNQQIKRAQIQGGVYQGRGPIARASSRINRGLNSSPLTGSMGTRTAQQAAQTVNKLEAENVEAARAQIEQANLTRAELRTVAGGGAVKGISGSDAGMRAAAVTEQFARGDIAGAQDSWNSVVGAGDSRGGKELKRVVANAAARSKERPGFLGQGALQALREGKTKDFKGNSLRLETQASAGADRYSDSSIAQTSIDELEYVVNANGGVVPPAMRDRAASALADKQIGQTIGANRAWLEFFAGTGPRPARTP